VPAEEGELLAAIRAAPRDDASRRVYADWLLERGDPRGELIAVQCEQARTPWYAPRFVELERLSAALIGRHIDRWLGGLDPRLGPDFRRGMIEGITVDDPARLAPLAEDGLVHRATVRADPSGWDDLHRIDELELSMSGEPELLYRLAAHPRLRLRRLDLSKGFDMVALEAFAGGAFPELERLRIYSPERRYYDEAQEDHDYAMDRDGPPSQLDQLCRLLAGRAGSLRSLRWLSVHLELRAPGGLGPAGCEALGALPVEELWLDGNPIRDQGAAVLARSPASARLRGLSLRRASIGVDGAMALAGSPHLRGLRWLDLSENPLGAGGLAALNRSEVLGETAIFVDPPEPPMARLRSLEIFQRGADWFRFPEHA
jgi:uncharacterized protein (TIGR02996 family)